MTDINLQTKIWDMLEAYPHLEDKLINISPVFEKLQNPILRRTVARVATVKQVADVGGISPAYLVTVLRQAAGLSPVACDADDVGGDPEPDWFSPDKVVIVYDAIPIVEAGKTPMQEILKLADTLAANEIMHLKTSFRPAPIIELLHTRGFKIWYNSNNTYILSNLASF